MSNRPGLRPRTPLGLLALIAGQDVELVAPGPQDAAGGGGALQWRIARKVAHDRVISVVDAEARHAHKTVHRRQDGFKAHLVIEPDSGLVTAGQLTKAHRSGQPRRHRGDRPAHRRDRAGPGPG